MSPFDTKSVGIYDRSLTTVLLSGIGNEVIIKFLRHIMQSGNICGSELTIRRLLLIRLPQCCVPAAFQILSDLDLPWLTTDGAVFYVGLAVSPALIDVQLNGLTAVGAI